MYDYLSLNLPTTTTTTTHTTTTKNYLDCGMFNPKNHPASALEGEDLLTISKLSTEAIQGVLFIKTISPFQVSSSN